jgi:hypothetical protein
MQYPRAARQARARDQVSQVATTGEAARLVARVRRIAAVTGAMSNRGEERAALMLFVESVRAEGSADLIIHRDDPEDFPDFILVETASKRQTWVEIVKAVESGELIASERRAWRLYEAAAREYRARGEEVVLKVSARGVEDVTPSPGFGVTGTIILAPPRKITPPEWIARALDQKGRADRYGLAERARTTLVIDCSGELLVDKDDAGDVRDDLQGNTLGFKEVWCVSANWPQPRGLCLAP